MDENKQVVQVVETLRLSKPAYEQLERLLPKPVNPSDGSRTRGRAALIEVRSPIP